MLPTTTRLRACDVCLQVRRKAPTRFIPQTSRVLWERVWYDRTCQMDTTKCGVRQAYRPQHHIRLVRSFAHAAPETE